MPNFDEFVKRLIEARDIARRTYEALPPSAKKGINIGKAIGFGITPGAGIMGRATEIARELTKPKLLKKKRMKPIPMPQPPPLY